MNNNNFLQLALLSFAGLVVVVIALAFIGSGSMMNNNMIPNMNGHNVAQMNMNGMSNGYNHMPQNMPMGNGVPMMAPVNQNMYGHYNHPNYNPHSQYGSMDTVNYDNMGGGMNMPMGNTGMAYPNAPMIIVVPVPNMQNSNGMNGMNQMNGMGNMGQGKMMMMGM